MESRRLHHPCRRVRSGPADALAALAPLALGAPTLGALRLRGPGDGDGTLIGTANPDHLIDLGRCPGDDAGTIRALPQSNDAFVGLGRPVGAVHVIDFGGSADTLDLRPFGVNDISFEAVDADSSGSRESLPIMTRPIDSVMVIGFRGPDADFGGPNGRIETLRFADENLSAAAARLEGKATTPKQTRLAEAAPRLAAAARRRPAFAGSRDLVLEPGGEEAASTEASAASGASAAPAVSRRPVRTWNGTTERQPRRSASAGKDGRRPTKYNPQSCRPRPPRPAVGAASAGVRDGDGGATQRAWWPNRSRSG